MGGEEVRDTWLDRDIDDLDLLGKLLVPADPQATVLRSISTEVNNVRNDGAHLLQTAEVPAPPEDPRLL